MVSEISGTNEFNGLIKSGMVLVDFYADWCMPCIMMAPIIDELSKDFAEKIRFVKVNIEENQELAQKFNIMSIPNFVLFKDGKQETQFMGSMSAEDFKEKLKNYI
jgi:thioredoxin 1